MNFDLNLKVFVEFLNEITVELKKVLSFELIIHLVLGNRFKKKLMFQGFSETSHNSK